MTRPEKRDSHGKQRYVQVTDPTEIEAVKLGIAGELKAPIGVIYTDGACWAEADSLRKWREFQSQQEP